MQTNGICTHKYIYTSREKCRIKEKKWCTVCLLGISRIKWNCIASFPRRRIFLYGRIVSVTISSFETRVKMTKKKNEIVKCFVFSRYLQNIHHWIFTIWSFSSDSIENVKELQQEYWQRIAFCVKSWTGDEGKKEWEWSEQINRVFVCVCVSTNKEIAMM